MGWRRDVKIWAASCVLAAVSGVSIGLVSVAVARSDSPSASSAGALPTPNESRSGRKAPSATGAAEAAGGPTTSVAPPVGAPSSTERSIGASAKKHSGKKDPSAETESHDNSGKGSGESSDRSKGKDDKPNKPDESGKPKAGSDD